jgi:uracil phosphoribosyltransferase
MPLSLVQHPILADVLGGLRDKRTPPEEFRRLAHRAGLILACAATADLPVIEDIVETPLETTRVSSLGGVVVAVPILRAGLGLLDAFLEVVPAAAVGYVGIERNEETALPRRYYQKLPQHLEEAFCFILDPMLATGGSAALAAQGLRDQRAREVRLVSVVAAPEGVERVAQVAPEVKIFVGALDRGLNASSYILPGLGDFGDRLFDT